MALGQAVKAQMIVVQNKGWDPTVITDKDGKTEDISNWDKQPKPGQISGTPAVGNFTESSPPQQGDYPAATEGSLDERVDFNHPADPRSYKDHHTVNADPFCGRTH
jgi:hypothetical protein